MKLDMPLKKPSHQILEKILTCRREVREIDNVKLILSLQHKVHAIMKRIDTFDCLFQALLLSASCRMC